jgi:hypothetical protein
MSTLSSSLARDELLHGRWQAYSWLWHALSKSVASQWSLFVCPAMALRVCLSRRYARLSLVALALIVALPLFVPHESRSWLVSPRSALPPGYPSHPIPREITPPSPYDLDFPPPPLYEQYTAYQDSFPQHNETLPSPEGSSAKFVYFANQVWGAGWGNVMQQIVMNGQLAYASGRT